MAIYFDNFLLVAVTIKGKICLNADEVEACAILYALSRDKEFEYHKTYHVFYAPEVITTINGSKDCASKNFVEDIAELAHFFQLISIIFLGGLIRSSIVFQSLALRKMIVLNGLNLFHVG